MRHVVVVVLAALAALSAPALAGPDHDHWAEGAAPDDHTHAGGGLSSPDLLANESWSHTFTEPGLFEYHCHPHPWMQASIEILASEGGPARNHTITVVEPSDFEKWAFSVDKLTIFAGDTVTWNNTGQRMHTVSETTAEHAEHIASAGGTVTEDSESHTHEDLAAADATKHTDSGVAAAALWAALGAVTGAATMFFVTRK